MRLAHGLSADLFTDLLGKPFTEKGRGNPGYDCLGLTIEVARRLGRQLPDYVSSEDELHAQLGAGASTLGDLEQIPRPEPGCVVLLRMRPDQHHLAVMVDQYRMIHTSRQTGCVIERVLSPLWARKVIGYYRLTPTEAP
jgi:cell wall-associated NlpC family hydrolase